MLGIVLLLIAVSPLALAAWLNFIVTANYTAMHKLLHVFTVPYIRLLLFGICTCRCGEACRFKILQ